MTSSNCSINLVWLESLEVGRFGHFYRKTAIFRQYRLFTPKVLYRFLSNLAYKPHMTRLKNSISFVQIDSVEVCHLSPSLTQMGRSMLKLPMFTMANAIMKYLAYYSL